MALGTMTPSRQAIEIEDGTAGTPTCNGRDLRQEVLLGQVPFHRALNQPPLQKRTNR